MNHFVFKCPKFNELYVRYRKQFVIKHELCVNWLSGKHYESQCKSTFSYHIVNRKIIPAYTRTNFRIPQYLLLAKMKYQTRKTNLIQTFFDSQESQNRN